VASFYRRKQSGGAATKENPHANLQETSSQNNLHNKAAKAAKTEHFGYKVAEFRIQNFVALVALL
jgi:hypothetical protein